jgi:hypothetical protein
MTAQTWFMKRLLCCSLAIGMAMLAAQSVSLGACSYAVTPSDIGVGFQGASGSFTIVTTSGCYWTAQASHSWIHTSSSSYSIGSVMFTVDPNPNSTPRTGTISVEGAEFTIKQSGNGCFATLTQTNATRDFAAQSGSFELQSPTECSWTATSGFSWIHTSSAGSGPGTVQYSLDYFAGPGTREGSIGVLDQIFSISQLGESEVPAISTIPDQKLSPGIPTAPIPFRVSGAFADVNAVSIMPSSSNARVMPEDAILVGGSGADRILLLVPPFGGSGTARITITARDAKGATASTSFTVILGTLQPPGFDLSGVARDASGRFKCLVTGPPGGTVVIQGSSDLLTWIDLATLTNATGVVDYTDTFASGLRLRFYRLKTP